MRWLLALICLSFATLSPASTQVILGGKPVEKILVLKSAHQLQLINDGERSLCRAEARSLPG